jgi:hypothetical protein
MRGHLSTVPAEHIAIRCTFGKHRADMRKIGINGYEYFLADRNTTIA